MIPEKNRTSYYIVYGKKLRNMKVFQRRQLSVCLKILETIYFKVFYLMEKISKMLDNTICNQFYSIFGSPFCICFFMNFN